MKRKIDRARELCSHSVKPGNLPALFERALDLLIGHEEKRRYSVNSLQSKETKRRSGTQLAHLELLRSHQDSDPFAPQEPTAHIAGATAATETSPRVSPYLESVDANEEHSWHIPRRDVDPAECIDAESRGPLPCIEQDPDPAERHHAERFAAAMSANSKQFQQFVTPVGSEAEPTLRAQALRSNAPKFGFAQLSRHVPAAVSRGVWQRDGGQCTYIDEDGNRCTAREFLEIDHIKPHARGGLTTIANCRLLCHSHNQYGAKLAYGTDFMNRARSQRRHR